MRTSSSLLVWLLFLSTATAQDTGSGLDFLTISPTAKLLSLSGAATATPTGPAAIYINPALLAFEEDNSVEVNYTLWIADVTNQYAALTYLKKTTALAAGVFYSASREGHSGTLPGSTSGSASVNYLSISTAAAHRIGSFSVGLSLQYLREEVFQFRSNGFGFNGGITAQFLNSRIRTALSATNLGEMESLDGGVRPLPSGLNAGISADFLELATSGRNDLPLLFTVHLNWQKPVWQNQNRLTTSQRNSDPIVSAAISADIGNLFVLMAGYRYGSDERPYSTGISMLLEPVRISYALVPFTTGFGTVHSFGLQYLF